MYRKQILFVLLAVALVTMSCGINIQMPVTQVKTGPTITDQISAPLPEEASSTTTDLTLAFGAGKMILNPGATEGLLQGEATYNVADFKPTVTSDGHQVKLEQGDLTINGIPSFDKDVKNTWDLKLANTPMNLTIKAGAYEGTFELGGLSLKDLDINDGASSVNVSFKEPNQAEMGMLSYSTGASDVTLTGLANANFQTMNFKGGAGSYKLDFTGTLKQDCTVTVDSGISSVVIVIPPNVNAIVKFEGGLSNVDASNTWTKQGSDYAQKGTGPTITIKVNMGAGNLELRNP